MIGAEQMQLELEAFAELRGLEHGTLAEFLRFLGTRNSSDDAGASGGGGGGAGGGGAEGGACATTAEASMGRLGGGAAPIYRLAPTTRRRAELFFDRLLEHQLQAELRATAGPHRASREEAAGAAPAAPEPQREPQRAAGSQAEHDSDQERPAAATSERASLAAAERMDSLLAALAKNREALVAQQQQVERAEAEALALLRGSSGHSSDSLRSPRADTGAVEESISLSRKETGGFV